MTTDLERQIQEEEKQLAELLKQPEGTDSEKLVDETIADATVEEPEETKAEEVPEDETEEQKKKRLNAEAGRKRIEEKELKKQLEDERLKNARLEGFNQAAQQVINKQPEVRTQPQEDKEPDKDLDPDAHLRWELRRERSERLKDKAELEQIKLDNQIIKAKNEVRGFDTQYSAVDPDYSAAKKFFMDGLTAQIKAQNPGVQDHTITEWAEKAEVALAAQAIKAGIGNPAIYFKSKAIENGFIPPVKEKEDKVEVKPKLDLKALEANKKKSANLMGGSSRGKVGDPSPEDIVGMTIAEMAELNDGVWNRLR